MSSSQGKKKHKSKTTKWSEWVWDATNSRSYRSRYDADGKVVYDTKPAHTAPNEIPRGTAGSTTDDTVTQYTGGGIPSASGYYENKAYSYKDSSADVDSLSTQFNEATIGPTAAPLVAYSPPYEVNPSASTYDSQGTNSTGYGGTQPVGMPMSPSEPRENSRPGPVGRYTSTFEKKSAPSYLPEDSTDFYQGSKDITQPSHDSYQPSQTATSNYYTYPPAASDTSRYATPSSHEGYQPWQTTTSNYYTYPPAASDTSRYATLSSHEGYQPSQTATSNYYATPPAASGSLGDATQPSHGSYQPSQTATSNYYTTSSTAVEPSTTYPPVNTLQKTAVAVDPSNSGAITSNEARRVIKGTKGKQDSLHPNFKIHNSTYFRPGQVFKILWSEPSGENPNATEVTPLETKYGQKVHSTIRRFVIVAGDQGHCQCLPILTYQRQGTTKWGVKHDDHAIIYAGDTAPPPVDGEKLTKPPIQMIPQTYRDKLEPTSRINYAKIYTVEHNVKVCFIGHIAQTSERQLMTDFDDTWSKKRQLSGD